MILLEERTVARTVDDADDVLRRELGSLRMSALRKRARALRIAEEELEEAEDGAAPREAFVELIVAMTLRD